MNRRKAYLAASLLLRMGAGIASLLFLARGLGPADYGFVVTVFAYASIVALVSDFGAPIKLLRDAGAQPERVGAFVAASLRIKTVLVSVASLGLLAGFVLFGRGPELFWVSLLLYASIIVLSYGDLALVALRALGRHGDETWVVLAGTLVFIAALAGAMVVPNLLLVALALFLARTVQAVLSFAVLGRVARIGNWLAGHVRRDMREAAGLAVDTILTAISGQLDVIFVSALLGLEATGIYQVAARVSGYAMMPAQVLAGVYTPVLAKQRGKGDAAKLEARMRVELPLVGAALAAFVGLVMPVLAPWVFGPQFQVPSGVWAGFAAMVFARVGIGGMGIALVARGAVRARLIGQGVGMVALCGGMALALPTFGIVAAPWVVTAATSVTAAIYFSALTHAGNGQAVASTRWRKTA